MKLKTILNKTKLSVLCYFILIFAFILSMNQYIRDKEKGEIIKENKKEIVVFCNYHNNTDYRSIYYDNNSLIKYKVSKAISSNTYLSKQLYEFIKTEIEKEESINYIPIPMSAITTKTSECENEIETTYIDVICKVVEAETHGADYDSKVRIVHVIRNRVSDGRFPNDYISVCTQANQFASRSDVEDSTRQAVNDALNMSDTTNGALWFCTCSSGCWASANATYLFTDSVGHNFWK